MSISVTTVEITYDGNAVASQYAYPFRIDNKSAIEVYVSGVRKTEGTVYTVSGVGSTTGGTVSFVASLVPGSGIGNVKLYRNSDPTHSLDYSEGGSLPVQNLEASFDRLAMVIQEHRDWIDQRVVKIPRTHTASSWNGSLADPGALTSLPKVLGMRASGIVLFDASLASIVDPLTTQGDVLGYDTSGPARHGIGSTGAILHVNASTGDLIDWGSGATSLGQIPYWTASTVGYTSVPTVNRSNLFYNGTVPTWAVPQPAGYVDNLGFAASTTTSALTFTMIGGDGNAVSTANPVTITFRSSIASIGLYSTIQTASVIQITLNEGATLGSAGSATNTGRAYIYGCNDGGEIKLGIARQALFDEGVLQTTTAMASTADSDNILYTVSALTSVPVVLIGMTEFTAGAVAASWEATPIVLAHWKPGMRKTGDVVQVITKQADGTATTTGTIPVDNTIPQIDEGAEATALALTITPTSAINKMFVNGQVYLSNSAVQNYLILSIFRDGTSDALVTTNNYMTDATGTGPVNAKHSELAGGTSAITYEFRFGASAAGTTTLSLQTYGGVENAYSEVREVYV